MALILCHTLIWIFWGLSKSTAGCNLPAFSRRQLLTFFVVNPKLFLIISNIVSDECLKVDLKDSSENVWLWGNSSLLLKHHSPNWITSITPDCHSVHRFSELSHHVSDYKHETRFIIVSHHWFVPLLTTKLIQKLSQLKVYCLISCQGDKVQNAYQKFLRKKKSDGDKVYDEPACSGSKQTTAHVLRSGDFCSHGY